jgi:hypothetical protein
VVGSQSFGTKQRNVFASQLQQIGLFAGLGLVGDNDERTSGFRLHNRPSNYDPWTLLYTDISCLMLIPEQNVVERRRCETSYSQKKGHRQFDDVYRQSTADVLFLNCETGRD